jgi:hypothetical protein
MLSDQQANWGIKTGYFFTGTAAVGGIGLYFLMPEVSPQLPPRQITHESVQRAKLRVGRAFPKGYLGPTIQVDQDQTADWKRRVIGERGGLEPKRLLVEYRDDSHFNQSERAMERGVGRIFERGNVVWEGTCYLICYAAYESASLESSA